jgi:CRISPR-associated protein Cas2
MTYQRSDLTCYVVAYDIPNDKRRTKLHNVLSGLGKWTQYSLFEIHLTPKELVALQARLIKLIDEQEDSVRFYPLCGACLAKVVTIGSPKPAPILTLIA